MKLSQSEWIYVLNRICLWKDHALIVNKGEKEYLSLKILSLFHVPDCQVVVMKVFLQKMEAFTEENVCQS